MHAAGICAHETKGAEGIHMAAPRAWAGESSTTSASSAGSIPKISGGQKAKAATEGTDAQV